MPNAVDSFRALLSPGSSAETDDFISRQLQIESLAGGDQPGYRAGFAHNCRKDCRKDQPRERREERAFTPDEFTNHIEACAAHDSLLLPASPTRSGRRRRASITGYPYEMESSAVPESHVEVKRESHRVFVA